MAVKGSMPVEAQQCLLTRPKVAAPLDPNFSPFVLGRRNYVEAVKKVGDAQLHVAIERNGGFVARQSFPVFPDDHPDVAASIHMVPLLVRLYMWQRGACKMLLSGPPKQCTLLRDAFVLGGKFAYDTDMMRKASGRSDAEPFEVSIVDLKDLPEQHDETVKCGRVADGCRLAFDCGKSDVKAVAVKDGECIFSKETEWDVTNPDPSYHYGVVTAALKEAAAKLDKVEAVGGSITGIVSPNNEATLCDLFPCVPWDVYKEKVPNLFNELIKKEFDGVPLKVINDGEVTAVAGEMMIGEGALFGLSLGSNAGCGYVDADGNLPGWINEMSHTPFDLNPEAPPNPWTPYRGDTGMYLGQRAATKLVLAAGMDVPEEMKPESPQMLSSNHALHAQCLKLVQAAMKDPSQEPQVRKIYETIGVYLGYAVANYVELYAPLPLKHVLILGRVTSGTGGQIIMDKAKEVLMVEFPEISDIKFHTPDERMKRVGQCVAAAALPPLKRAKSV